MTAEAKFKAMINKMADDLGHVLPKPAAGRYLLDIDSGGNASWSPYVERFTFSLGGQYLLDPNEVNTIGIVGPYDQTNSQDVGDATGANSVADAGFVYTVGGVEFPFAVKILDAKFNYRINNGAARAFGFLIGSCEFIEDSTARRPSVLHLDEVADNAGVGPRDPANTRPFTTGKLSINSAVIPEGDIITWGVSAPTADATNRYVQVSSGYLYLERIFP